MKSTFFASFLLLGTMASSAMAQGPDVLAATDGWVKLSDAQMDAVRARLITVIAVDVVDVNNNDVDVAVPIAANVAANILGVQRVIQDARPGRINQ